MRRKMSAEERKAKRAAYAREYNRANRDTITAKRRARYQGDPEFRRMVLDIQRKCRELNPPSAEEKLRQKVYNHWWHLRKNHGLTQEQFEAMWAAQGAKCLICGDQMTPWQDFKPSDRKAVNVEHSHVTGKIRGLVCNGCNLGLMWVEKYQDAVLRHLGIAQD